MRARRAGTRAGRRVWDAHAGIDDDDDDAED